MEAENRLRLVHHWCRYISRNQKAFMTLKNFWTVLNIASVWQKPSASFVGDDVQTVSINIESLHIHLLQNFSTILTSCMKDKIQKYKHISSGYKNIIQVSMTFYLQGQNA